MAWNNTEEHINRLDANKLNINLMQLINDEQKGEVFAKHHEDILKPNEMEPKVRYCITRYSKSWKEYIEPVTPKHCDSNTQ